MATILRPFLFFCLMISLFLPSSAQSCRSHSLSSNGAFSSCTDLPVLNSFLHWTYNNTNQLRIAYRHTGMQSSRWTAWAINPTGRGMAGAQALVAFQRSDGTPTVYTSPISGYSTTLAPGNLSFAVSNIRAEFTNNEMTIFATLQLPGPTTLNHVWQEGPLNGNSPSIHPTSGANVQSTGTLDVRSGQTGSGGTVVVRQKKKNTHGILNAVSWGILMPLGATIARYLRVFKSADPAWFYLHVGCQCSAYIVGVAGWATGLKLGSDSKGIQYNPHRNIGIILFSIATLQLFALLVRPKKDHKYRLYWNIYHHSIGYAVIILSVINIYKGFDILKPDKKWKRAYTGIIIALGANALWLEFGSTITKERFVVESLCASRSQRFLCFGTSGYMQESMESNTEFDSQPILEESVSPSMQIDPRRARFPCCIVWTPLPVISWLVPFIGHIGICREDGVILDFAGPNFVCVDNFTFGAVARYIQLSKEKCCISPGFTGNESKYPEFERETLTWDDSLRKSTQEFQNRSYNLFTCNCHSFVANNLNRLGYGGKGRWNVVNLAALIFLKGQWVNGAAILKAFLPFVLVLGLGLILGGWNFLIFLASFTFILVGWFVLGTYCFKSLIGL